MGCCVWLTCPLFSPVDDVPPYFKMEPPQRQVHLERNRLVLTCMAEGSWPLEFKWLYNGSELTRFSLEYRWEMVPELSPLSSIIVIPQLKLAYRRTPLWHSAEILTAHIFYFNLRSRLIFMDLFRSDLAASLPRDGTSCFWWIWIYSDLYCTLFSTPRDGAGT